MKKKLTFIIFVLFFIFLFLFNFLYEYELQDNTENLIYDSKWNILKWIKNISYENYNSIPNNINQIIKEIEDKRFYSHFWIDIKAISRAIHSNIFLGNRQWASTIDQQSIKLSQSAFFDRSILQKIKENFIAINLNTHNSKEDIFLYYINNLEFPNQVRWLNSACLVYFDNNCENLFLSELLFLVSIYQTGTNPLNNNNFDQLKKRSKLLCNQISNLDFVSDNICKNIYNLPPLSSNDIYHNFDNLANHYVDYIQSSKNNNSKNFDLDLHNMINNIIKNTFEYRNMQWMNDCCILVLDNTWEVLTMNICRSYEDLFAWQVNACTSRRQTWSVAKPFLYLYAMKELNLNSESILEDKPIEYILEWENIYAPKNFSQTYAWDVKLAQALWSSLNVPTVKLLNDVWVWNYINFIEKLRINVWKENKDKLEKNHEFFNERNLWLSAGLWTYEMSPLNFAKLWKIFFDINEYDFLDSYEVQIKEVYDILTKNSYRNLSFGIDSFMSVPWWAVKTWTSRRFVDWWTCGANKQKWLIVCVWAWNYNWTAMMDSWVNTAWYLWNLVVNNL